MQITKEKKMKKTWIIGPLMKRRGAWRCWREVRRKETLPWIFGRLAGEEHSLWATVAAVVITVLEDWIIACLLGLRTRGGLSPFLMRREKVENLICSHMWILSKFFLHAPPEWQRSARTIDDSEKQAYQHDDSSTGLQRQIK